jgi:hypothetical protein
MLAQTPALKGLVLHRRVRQVARRPCRAPQIDAHWYPTPPPRLVWLVVEVLDGSGRLEWRVCPLPAADREEREQQASIPLY